MKKNLKKIIAIALTINAFSAITPASNLNIITTKAYAASDELSSIKVKTSSGSTIKTYSDDDYRSKNEVDKNEFKSGKTYYARTSAQKIKINTDGTSSSNVRIFKGKSNSAKGVKESSSISLEADDTTMLTIRTYSEDPGSVKYSDDSYSSQYIIKVKCTADSSDSDDNQGDVYLKSINLSDGKISFSKNTSDYDINVDESVSKITIGAKPDCDSDEYDDYKVRINGTTVDEDDKFKKSVSLSKGKNEIKITVQNGSDDKRTYNLNITRGETIVVNTDENNGENDNNNSNSNTNSNNGNNSNISNNTGKETTSVNVKADQWVVVNGRWQYNDSTGNSLKSTWFYDKNYGKSYYLEADGYMATGWLFYGGNWYYVGSDGSMKTGWQLVNGSWYYLNPQGIMEFNTVINGYRLGSSGAWIR